MGSGNSTIGQNWVTGSELDPQPAGLTSDRPAGLRKPQPMA